MVGHAKRNLEEGHGGPPDIDRLWDAEELLDVLPDDANVVEAGVVEREVAKDDGGAGRPRHHAFATWSVN
ncbi:MAG: hypothetical protein GEU79_01240 [Acidimicrobiia bacterium]|nr:hypothetical protein [Acidimicrobiia bacterium]